MTVPEIRIGLGYDIHPLVSGRRLVLGGVEIPGPFGLDGHSDADCLTHALCDAILSAAGLPDIGHHFPNTEQRWKDADSQLMLQSCMNLITAEGWQAVNLSATVIAEKPRLQPFLQSMKSRLSRSTGLAEGSIGLTVTTNEGLGSLGRGEGIAAHAVALLSRLKTNT